MRTATAIMVQTSDTPIDRNSLPKMPGKAAGQKRRGRLKIFLGAAPGVGTTCEMIRAGIRKRRERVDAVVGAVETRGRKETESLLKEIEVVPSHGAAFNCRGVCEMDVDAVLARRPTLVLVDELAHINPSGARHPRRFMDVLELLRAGIDVYTTLNMQQVQSLNNIVARITRIRKGETVPDSVVNKADEIEVIDVAPQDIIQRLRGGKLSIWFAAL